MFGPRTLFAKLLLLFLGFGALMYVAFLMIMGVSHRRYHAEFDQLANRHLAQQYVDANLLVGDVPLTSRNYADALTHITAINPDVNVYVLDASGQVIASSAPDEELVRSRVDLTPITRFLDPQVSLPIRGDDPTSARGRQVFSAAPLSIQGSTAAYLYVVLNRHEVNAPAADLERTYDIGEGAGFLLTAVILAFAASAWFLRMLTTRLASLQRSMERFRDSDFRETALAPVSDPKRALPDDEIERLRVLCGELATRVREQMSDLQSSETQLRELLVNVSHDLRTPLSTLQAHLELLAADENLPTEERRSSIAITLQQSGRLARLVERTLDLVRIEAGQVAFQPEPFQIAELVHDVAIKHETAAHSAGVTMDLGLPQGVPQVVGDIGVIERVLDNLIENAVRYAGAAGRVSVRVAGAGNRVRVEVHNTGPGIPAADQQRLGEYFFRGDRSRSTRSESAGLGLSIARGLLNLHDSALEFRSNPTEGTTFFFELSVAPPSTLPGDPLTTAAPHESAV